MKKVIVVAMVALLSTNLLAQTKTDQIIKELDDVLLKCEVVRNSGPKIYQNQHQKQKQKQEQDQSLQNNWSFKNREVVQGILPDMPPQLFIPPTKEEASFWNKWGLPLEEYEGIYTRDQAKWSLKNRSNQNNSRRFNKGGRRGVCPIKAHCSKGERKIQHQNNARRCLEVSNG